MIKVKKAFIYDLDGIFKDFPLTRWQALKSIFLTRDEKIEFFRGKVPRRIKQILSSASGLSFEDTGKGSLQVYFDEINTKKEKLKSEENKEGVLILFRTPKEIKTVLIHKGEAYGEVDFLRFFLNL